MLCAQRIAITFNRLDLEDTGNCVADSVTVYDGADTTSRLLGKFCGDERPGDLASSGHYLFVVFRSNHKRNTGSFSLSWSAVGAQGTDDTANGIVVLSSNAFKQLLIFWIGVYSSVMA